MWPVVQFYFSNMSKSKCSFSWNLDTKFCLHPAGGIHVYDNFEHSGGNTEVSNSSAKRGGAVLMSSCCVFGRILRWLWALGDQLQGLKLKRIEEISIDFHDLPSMFETKLDSQLVLVLTFCSFPVPYVSREEGGCLSSSLLLSMILELTQDVNV